MRTVIITGGLGFIGVNTALRFLGRGFKVVVLDNMSRPGTSLNLNSLTEQFGDQIVFEQQDVRNADDVSTVFKAHSKAEAVYHLAGQVAVTTSVADPREDFEINALGTLNVLEAVRHACPEALLVYSSTNKVYGGMEGVSAVLSGQKYVYENIPQGVSESMPLDFHSPYGCSKGSADQYVRDYSRIYGLRTIVCRQSCIYGPRQFGVEDQGWVAWFTIAAILGRPIVIYGDGMQTRDVLHVDDLVALYESLLDRSESQAAGGIYNIGGGPDFVMSLLELLSMLEDYLGAEIPHTFADWRPGDQKVYISNIEKAQKEIGWRPRFAPSKGVELLFKWVKENKESIEKVV